MTDIQDLSTVRVQYKAQSALGTPASGSGGYGIEVLPSSGLAVAIASIESNMMRRSRMRKRPRHGPKTVTGAYETELVVGAMDPIFEAVLGGTWTAALSKSNADWGAVVISGTGVTATFATGQLITAGVTAGMMIKFTNLSVSGNNSIWVPILAVVSETVATLASGYIIDNVSDAAWNATIAKSLYTATPYTDRYITFEENWPELDKSKLASDLRFNSLNFDIAPGAYVKVGFGLGGRDLSIVSGAAAPNFTTPTYVEGDSLILLDGGLYVNGTKRTDLTGLKFGLSAPVSSTGVIGTNVGPDVSLGEFALTGDFTGVVSGDAEWTAMDAETDISVLLHCKEKNSQNFVSIYVGYMSYAGYSTPAGGDGNLIETIPLYGGEDVRGAGYAPTSILISTSAA